MVHFALHRGAGISGVVRLPDGSPLAGAMATLATQAVPAYIQNGRHQLAMTDQRIVRSRADGRFTLPPCEPPFKIVVVHDRGHAERNVQARPALPLELSIQPWSRVEGTLRIGRGPGGNQKLALDRIDRADHYPCIVNFNFVDTDALGRFTFEHVLPGQVRVSRAIKFGDSYSSGGSPAFVMDVAPAATVRLTFGGTGRPIVGKVTLPA